MIRIIKVIALVLLVFFQFSGSHVIFHFQRAQIRKEIKLRIKKGVPESELFVFEKSQIEENITWTKSNEFVLNDNFFDVVYTDTTSEGIVWRCVSDQQENILFRNLDFLTHKEWSQSNSTTKLAIIPFPYFVNNNSLSRAFWSDHEKLFQDYTFSIIISFLEVFSPPPQMNF